MDKHKDGRLNFEDFLRHAEQRIECVYSQEDLRNSFEMFDKDGDGRLTLPDLKRAMLYLGLDPTHSQVKRMFKKIDSNNDGKIDFKEYILLVTRDFAKLQ
jgi:calmodulin